ncbi:MAG: phosphoglycolate phosphatase [Acidiferrobacteraceae bacterium]|jgi:2-phosphoglycolate phosphatase
MTEAAAKPSTIRTVLFDLDGTLADTAPDLAHALNAVLAENGRPPLPYERIRAEASYGGKGLVHLGFGLEPDDSGYTEIRQRFLDLYESHLCEQTRVFPGMDHVLSDLKRRGLNWGVVTNKPAYLTEPLMECLGLTSEAACIVSGDTTANNKPHPEPLLHGCALAGSSPAQCLYVGDAERDIRAGRLAGMQTLAARFGYIRSGDNPVGWGADAMIDTPDAILDWLDQHA